MAEKYHIILKQELKPIRQHHTSLRSALDDIMAAERELQSKKDQSLSRLTHHFDNLHKILDKKKSDLAREIDDLFQKKDDQITSKKKEISDVLSSLKSTIESVESSFDTESKSMFLPDVEKKKQNIKSVNDKAMTILPHVHPEDMEIEMINETELKDLCLSCI